MPAKISIFAEYVTFNCGPIFTLHVLSCLILRIEKKINEKKEEEKNNTSIKTTTRKRVFKIIVIVE